MVRIAIVEALEGHPQPRVLDALNQAVALERDAAVERLMLSAPDELASEASPVGQHEALP